MEVGCFMVRYFAPTPTPARQSLIRNSIQRKNINGSLKATANTDFHDDRFFQSAIFRASLRFQESLSSEPLFVDSYAGCFASPNLDLEHNSEQKLHSYCLGTRYIDDQLLSVNKGVDGAKQVVLFTDGMDTRAYRLNWSPSTVIYDVSPQAVYSKASQKLKDVGARIPRSCLLHHVPLESSDMQQLLRDKGFNGSRPSIWVFQGYPVANLASFKDILFMASSLAMKGCLFLGEFPIWLMETEMRIKPTVDEWMGELFMSYGFGMRILGYNDVAKNLGLGHGKMVGGDPNDNLLFVAEHLRFSDDQMEIWRTEFQRIEDEGDEDGFEEL